jgi:hypothetical protein
LFVCLFGNKIIAQIGPNCPAVCAGPGGSFTSGSLTVSSNTFYSNIIINNKQTLIVRSGFTLYVGQVGTPATTQVVDFQNGCAVVIEPGASLVVNGLLNNSNNSNGVIFNGTVSVDGNITAGQGSIVSGSGSLSSTGTVIGAGTVFGTTDDCTSGNGCNYGCSPNAISSHKTICSGGTVDLTGNTGTGYSYQWQSSTTSASIGFSNISGATLDKYTSSALTTTTYFRRIVSVSGCSSSNSNVIMVTVNSPSTPATKIWNGTAWSPTGSPTANQNIEFTGNYEVAVDITACSCKVTSGTVTIPTGHNLILGGKLTVSGGSLTFEDDASLVQTTYTGANSGAIIYNRETPAIFNTDFTYWSSPVAGYTLGQLSPNTLAGMFYSFDADIENWKQEYLTTIMNVGVGYIVRGPEPTGQLPSTQIPFSATFKGVPNNGTIPVAISYTKAVPDIGTSNLIGNPYPSALDANAFLSANSEFIEGTLYFWTHSTGRINGQYNNDDYASYNITGGVRTGNYVNGIEQVANRPSGKIAAGQAFFATGIKKGSAIFNNSMRVSGNNSQFFKTKNPKGKTSNTFEKNRIWLNLTNTEGAFKQTLIGYVTDATNDYDNLFDGESFDGNEFVDFYSVNQDRNLVIQGRALPLEETDEVPLGYRTTIDGIFTINIDEVDGSMIDQAVFIEDKLTNTVFNLKTGNYTFNTVAGTFNDRFVLRYNNKTLGTENFDSPANKVLVSNANKQIKINSFAETIDNVVIYDLLGRQIFQKTNVNNNELSIANLISSHQTLVVKTLLQNGNSFTDKIIY